MELHAEFPKKLWKKVHNDLRLLKEVVTKESADSFKRILNDRRNFQIYSIGLHYQQDDWSYIVPTFSTEEGLREIAKVYSKHSPRTYRQEMISLRWSPCDSPHHAGEDLESMMPQTEDCLAWLRIRLDDLNPYLNAKDWPEGVPFELYNSFVSEVYDHIHQCVVDALQRVRQVPEIYHYLIKNECALVLHADDFNQDELLDHVRIMNDQVIYERVKFEMNEANRVESFIVNLDSASQNELPVAASL